MFFGSGLLFLGMLFVAAAVVGAMLIAFRDEPRPGSAFRAHLLAALGYLLAASLLIGSSFVLWSFASLSHVGAVAEHPDPGR